MLRSRAGVDFLPQTLQIAAKARLGGGPCTMILYGKDGEAGRVDLQQGASARPEVDGYGVTPTLLKGQETNHAANPDLPKLTARAPDCPAPSPTGKPLKSQVGQPYDRVTEARLTLAPGKSRNVIVSPDITKNAVLPETKPMPGFTGRGADVLRPWADRQLCNRYGYSM